MITQMKLHRSGERQSEKTTIYQNYKVIMIWN